jgi:hypothetical protein
MRSDGLLARWIRISDREPAGVHVFMLPDMLLAMRAEHFALAIALGYLALDLRN